MFIFKSVMEIRFFDILNSKIRWERQAVIFLRKLSGDKTGFKLTEGKREISCGNIAETPQLR
jgi:hypothetical protein